MSIDDNTVAPLPRAVQWAIGWLMICCSLFAVNALMALFGLHVTAFSLPICVVVALVLLYWIGKKDGRVISIKRLLAIGVVFMIATVMLGYAVASIWEYSYWGRGFYTDAVAKLAGGWNPIYAGASGTPEIIYRSGKAVWTMDAAFYAFLGHYEMAKLQTIMFAIPTLLLVRHFFVRLFGGHTRLSTLTALLLLLNPVAISQLFTYYDDAALAYISVCFLILAYLTLNEGYLHGDLLLTMSLVWIFILNMQMGGVRTAIILGIAFIIFVAIFYKKQALKWLCIRAVLVVIVGFVIVGFNPFMQNLLDTGNPFCLFFGEHAVNVTTAYMPWVLEGKTQFGQFLYSMLASPNTNLLNLNIGVQQLTAVVNSAYAEADVRLRGFGFIGGVLLVMAAILLVFAAFIRRKPDTEDDAIYFDGEKEEPEYDNYLSERAALLWMGIPIIFLVLFCATPWWARTIAVAWTLIPLAVVALCVRRGNGKSGVAKSLLILAFLNCGLMAFSTLSAVTTYTVDMQGHWERMRVAELPDADDARKHNEYMTNFKTWNVIKGQGESECVKKGLWTKVEGIIK